MKFHSESITKKRLDEWFYDAQPGDKIIYYVGWLAKAADEWETTKKSKSPPPPQPEHITVATAVRRLVADGWVDPVQRRLKSGLYEYIAILRATQAKYNWNFAHETNKKPK